MDKISICKIQNIDFNNITYGKKTSDNNIDIINIQYIDKNGYRNPFFVQIDDLYMTDDVQEIKDMRGITHEILLSLISRNTQKTEEIKDFFEALDNKFMEDAKKNDWGVKDTDKYKTYIKNIDTDGYEEKEEIKNYIYNNGLIKLKLIKSKKMRTIVFDKKKNIINEEHYMNVLKGGNYIKSIIEIVSIWKKDDVFGVYIRPHQMRISKGSPPIFVLKKYSFEDSSDTIDDNLISDTEVAFTNVRNYDDYSSDEEICSN